MYIALFDVCVFIKLQIFATCSSLYISYGLYIYLFTVKSFPIDEYSSDVSVFIKLYIFATL